MWPLHKHIIWVAEQLLNRPYGGTDVRFPRKAWSAKKNTILTFTIPAEERLHDVNKDSRSAAKWSLPFDCVLSFLGSEAWILDKQYNKKGDRKSVKNVVRES